MQRDEPQSEASSTPAADETQSHPATEAHAPHAKRTTLTGSAVLATWVSSVAVHLLLFAVMFVLPWLSGMVESQDDLPVAKTQIIGKLEREVVSAGTVPDLTRFTPTPTLDELKFTPDQTPDVTPVSAASEPEMSIIGVGSGGGDASAFGLSVGAGGAPELFGIGGSAKGAKTVVYVVDRSGSMLTTFDAVRAELRRSIGELRRSQKFHVILFNEGRPLENPPRRLVSAIGGQKEEFFHFLAGVEPEGGTHPEPAMRRALTLEPDMIFFLTDGMFDPSLVNQLDVWNRDRKVRIFTIAYVSEEGGPLLEKIAREHRGEYRFVSEDELFR